MAKNNQKNGNGAKSNGVKRNGNGNGNKGIGKGPKRMAGRGQMGGVNAMNTQLGLMNAQANVRPMVQNSQVLQGSDFLTTVRVLPSPTTTQRLLNEVFISPSFFPGTRLTQMSQLWERYRFTSFRIRYVPAVPTTLACQLVIYFDTDPADDPATATDPDTLIRQAVAHTGAQQWNFNLPKVVALPQRSDDQMYYTGETKTNIRFNLQAKAYVLQVTDPLNFNGEAITDDVIAGSIYIDWVCKFQLPQINPSGFAQRDATVATVIVTNGETITSAGILRNMTGLKPYKQYIICASYPTSSPSVPSGYIALQPAMSVREEFTITTNRAQTWSGNATDLEYMIAVGTSDANGNIPCWVYSSGASVTTAGNVQYYARPA